MAEEPSRFATRVSERLRHKQRALSMWDYEHLALERFPELFKVKCLPVDPTAAGRPGSVEIVVIPDIRDKLPFNTFSPKAAPELLAEIHAYLSARAPAAAEVIVKNAHFRTVKVGFGVRFETYDDGADIVIGARIYATSLVDFIDRRPYVDYVTDVRLFYSDDGERFEPVDSEAPDEAYVAAGRPDGVIRAAPEHEIFVISGGGHRAELYTGIGFMKVDLDLKVG